MGVDLFLAVIIWLLIAGFIYLVAQKLVMLAPIDEWFKQIIMLVLWIVVAAIVLFKVIIPLLSAVAHINIAIH